MKQLFFFANDESVESRPIIWGYDALSVKVLLMLFSFTRTEKVSDESS